MHRTHQNRGRGLGVVLTAALLTVGLAACNPDASHDAVASASDPTSTGTAGPSDEERQLAFTRCLRENGVEVSDSGLETDQSGEGESSTTSMDAPEGVDIDKAMETCAHLAPAGEQPEPPSAEDLAMLRGYAACLREHGLDVADPDPQTGGLDMPEGEEGDQSVKAFDACAHHFDTDER